MSTGSIRAGQAFIELSTRDAKLMKGLQNASARLKAFGQEVSETGRSTVMMWSAIAAPAAMAVKVFADFDDQMRLCQAVTKATGKEFDALREHAKKLGRETSFTASQVASGMVALGRMGFQSGEIDAAIASVMDLSRVTGTDLAQSADVAANTMRMFGLTAGRMGDVVDILSTTANGSAQTLADLFEGLKQAAPVAANANEGIKDVCANLGILANMGIKGSMAGNALKKAYLQMADPKIRQYLEDTFGIVVTDGNGNLRKMADILTDVARAINGMPSAEKLSFLKEVFDIRGMTGAQGLIANVQQIEEFRRKLDESAGSAAKSAKAMDAGIGGTLRILASQIEGVAIALGQALVPFLRGLSEAFTPVITKITEFISQNGRMVTTVAQVVAGHLKLGVVIWGLGKVLSIVSGRLELLHTALMTLGGIIDGAKLWVANLSGALKRNLAVLRDYGAALALVREAMAANNGVLAANAFKDIAGAAGVAATAVNRYAMSILASSNIEVGKQALQWLKALPQLYTGICRRIAAYITTTLTATTVNGAFAVSCKTVGRSLSGMWKTISSAVVSLGKYIASVSAAGVATATLGGIVKVLTGVVAGFGKVLALIAAHPVIAALTVALAAIAATIGVIAYKCHQETEQAKKDAEQAAAAYERASKRTEKGQESRRQGVADMEALQKLAEASKKIKLSADEIETAVSLINKLEPFGSKSWASIDRVTGKITLAADAMKRFQKAAQQQAVMEAEAELKALEAQAAAVKKQMATYGGWRDKIWSPIHDTSVEYNSAFEKELDAIRAKQLAVRNRLVQAKGGKDEGVFGQNMGKTAADKVDDILRRHEVSLKEFQDAEKAAAEYEKKLADDRKSALEREIDQIDEAKKKYVEMLRMMIRFESQKQIGVRNDQKIAEWRKKLTDAENEANRLKQEARERENQKAAKELAELRRNELQRYIDKTVETDLGAARTLLAQLLKQSERAVAGAAKKLAEVRAEAEDPNGPGGVNYTENELERLKAAREEYELQQRMADDYRRRLQQVQDAIAKQYSASGDFSARAAMMNLGFGPQERIAKASEATAKNTGELTELFQQNFTIG